jgi:hypothetical protein
MPTYEQLLAERQSLQEENVLLKAQIDWLRRQLFGGGKSERLDRAQMLLQLDALEQQAAKLEAASRKISYERREAAKVQRRCPAEVFAHLPVKETIEIMPEEVKAQPEAFERIGEERSPAKRDRYHPAEAV